MTKPITPFDPEYVPQLKVQQAKAGGKGWKQQPSLALNRKPHGGAYARAVPSGKR